MPAQPPLRVIQWATGAVGSYALRSVLTRPEFRLAGVLVYDPDKVGLDAGPLVGLPECGVLCGDDVDAVLALDADCVLHMPLPAAYFGGDYAADLETVCAILSSGKNVITTTGFIYPQVYGPAVVDRLESACRKGGASVYGTGINPGFMSDFLPLALSGLSARLDHIYVRESSDFLGHPSRQIVMDLIGFGRAPKDYAVAVRPFRNVQRALFSESVQLVAGALGVRLDEVEETDEYELAAEQFEVTAGVVLPGTVCASRWIFSGLVKGRPFMTVECVYKADAAKVRRWPEPGFALHIEGRPQMLITIDEVSHGLAGAAAHAVNSIAAVCASPPGIRTVLDLPLATGRGTARLA
ncbi:diacylglycerol kinase [Sphaerisporangium krabiense]|uniref:4-hydroxy-tetrahydrodipicolinate reductase n=1 Tax=Sphaerisporangium krabiense TaxID=763782 RepID=A0A7W9DQQ5_9ACTN|nr:dihydrodipicolinate reductase [Sphaerisporangium krabiense]MBB5627711.1 4-hydroxy-tetrahydrodipicolinate reductase [Sphaerisporangium krabiense]GII61869.1 diacylglycerol kinase [Sphaerisporangium krabiense]